MSTNNRIGYLTWWTVGDVAAPYTDLNALAAQTGFPADCVPTPPSKRNIWEKATNIGGSRGLPLDIPQDARNQTFIRYGVDPVVRLLVRRVSDKSPKLCRHLVREAVIPGSPTHQKQLSLQTVAVMEFDCVGNMDSHYLVDDPEGWVDGNLVAVLSEIKAKQQTLQALADGEDVREGIRKLLRNLYRVALRNNGGVYFVPDQAPDAENLMKALRAYINGLIAWKTGQLVPACSVVTLRGDEATSFDIRQDIIASAVEEYKARLQDLVGRLKPVLDGKARDPDKTLEGVNADLLKINTEIATYKTSLSDEFAALGDMFKMLNGALEQAYRTNA